MTAPNSSHPLRLKKKHGEGQRPEAGAADGARLVRAQSLRNAVVAGLIVLIAFCLLWADFFWMSRLSDWEAPGTGIAGSMDFGGDWEGYKARRAEADARLEAWAAGLRDEDLAGDLAWYSGALGREVTRPKALCVLHMLNHQTHHRGQVHAMLTAAGARPGDTDLFAMPGLA